ncbi:hypothetical protein LEMLEM_LOCUS5021 [Lemmus lemmus]
MGFSIFSPTRSLDGVFGFLQVVFLLCLFLVLFKAVQFYLRRQWMLKTFQKFPSTPSHWLWGHYQKLFEKDKELQQILTWVETFPSACLQWLSGSRVRVLLYDPDYVKVILGRSGKRSIASLQLQHVYHSTFIPQVCVILERVTFICRCLTSICYCSPCPETNI